MNIDTIKDLIANNRVQSVINALKGIIKSIGDKNTLVSIEASYKQIVEEENKGLLNYDQISISKNNITNRLLMFVDKVYEEADVKKDEHREDLLKKLKDRYTQSKITKLSPRQRFEIRPKISFTKKDINADLVSSFFLIKEDKQTNYDELFDLFYRDLKRLLIIGGSGSGKTFLANEFAIKLIEIAQVNENFPITVMVDVTNWDNSLSFREWLLENLKYFVGDATLSYQYSKELIENYSILPIIDNFNNISSEGILEKILSIEKFINETRGSRHVGNDFPELIIISNDKSEYYSNIEVFAAVEIEKFKKEDITKLLLPFINENDPAAIRINNIISSEDFNYEVDTIYHLKLLLILAESKHYFTEYSDVSFEKILKSFIEYELKTIESSYQLEESIRWLSWISNYISKRKSNIKGFELIDLQPDKLPSNKLWQFRFIYGFTSSFIFFLLFIFSVLIIEQFFPSHEAGKSEKRNIVELTIIYSLVLVVMSSILGLITAFLLGAKEDVDKKFEATSLKQKLIKGIKYGIGLIVGCSICKEFTRRFLTPDPFGEGCCIDCRKYIADASHPDPSGEFWSGHYG